MKVLSDLTNHFEFFDEHPEPQMSRPASGFASHFSSYFILSDVRVQSAIQYDLKAYGKKSRKIKSTCSDVGLANE